jgi:hypothetical protein
MQHMDDSLWVSGVFNGHAVGNGFGPSRRAQLPSSLTAIPVLAPGAPSHSAWDLRTSTYYRRSFLNASGACGADSNVSCALGAGGGAVWVEQRWYAHATLPNLFVMEVELLPGDGGAAASPAGVGAYLRLALAGGGGSQGDINFTAPARASPALDAPLIATGWTQLAETPTTPLIRVGVLASNLTCASTPHGVWPVAVGAPLTFLTAVRTSIETAPGGIEAALAGDYAGGAAAAAAGALWAPHAAAWAGAGGAWDSGFEIAGRPDVAAAANASLAALLASVRPGREFGISPAGITSGWYCSWFRRRSLKTAPPPSPYSTPPPFAVLTPPARRRPRFLGPGTVDAAAAGARAPRARCGASKLSSRAPAAGARKGGAVRLFGRYVSLAVGLIGRGDVSLLRLLRHRARNSP